uniref:IS1634 family transposase n=1 Tax=Faecalibacillus intestinalis TaxID=1982626 RepID=UPI0022E39A6C|nr:transposase [Faecalibacillus intestinalis]
MEIDKMVEKARNLKTYSAKKSEYEESGKYITITSNDGDHPIVTLNEEAIKKDRDLAGYNMLVTSEIKMKDVEIYDAYHNLWRIEESFRVMKSELDARPVYLQKENSIKGHFLICYVTILLTRILQFKVLDNKYSTSKICEFYRNFRLVKVNDKKYINITRASEFITELGKKLNQPLTNYYLADRQIKMMHTR